MPFPSGTPYCALTATPSATARTMNAWSAEAARYSISREHWAECCPASARLSSMRLTGPRPRRVPCSHSLSVQGYGERPPQLSQADFKGAYSSRFRDPVNNALVANHPRRFLRGCAINCPATLQKAFGILPGAAQSHLDQLLDPSEARQPRQASPRRLLHP